VPPRRPNELADAIALLLSDRDRRLQMGERARLRQQEEFSLAAFVRRVEDLYEELFSQTSRAKREGWTPFPRVSRD
jgi:glycosyltransferase involved in cell wall biosynthesis